MKRRELLKRIAAEAKRQNMNWALDRQGANHDVFSLDGLIIPVPRHNEIGEGLAVTIFKECSPKLGERWWR